MEIKVLGTGCARCHNLDRLVRQTVKEMGLQADVEYVDDVKRLVSYKVMSTPVLVIDGQVKSVGKVPSRDELVKLLGPAEKAG
jgi:small redox-active disulfide protein 2